MTYANMDPLPRPPVLFFFEPVVPATPMSDFVPDMSIDISAVFDAKMRALEALATQADLPVLYRLYGAYRGQQARVLAGLGERRFAEAFSHLYPKGDTNFDG